MTANIRQCSPQKVKENLKDANVCLIDVREPVEFLAEKIEGTLNQPLSGFDKNITRIPKDKEVVVICKTGFRSEQAAQKLADAGWKDISVLKDGLEAWKAAGLPVASGACRVWTLERQVRFAAGSLILAGLLSAWLIHFSLIILSAVVGAGLIFSALTNTCGMAMLLAKMPWNKSAHSRPQNFQTKIDSPAQER